MHIHPFEAVYPNLDLIESNDHFFTNLARKYPQHRKNGYFRRAEKKAMYAYKISCDNGSHLGLVAAAETREFINGSMLKHENTISYKEHQTEAAVLARKAIMKPILLTYKKNKKVHSMLKEISKSADPIYSVRMETLNQLHEFWIISDPARLLKLSQLFKDHVSNSYIADGHHRVAVMANLYRNNEHREDEMRFDFMLSAFFSSDQLEIHDYNRVIEWHDDQSPSSILEQIKRVCRIFPLSSPSKPRKREELTILCEGKWFRLQWKKSILRDFHSECILPDTFLLNKLILAEIFGIEDMRRDERIQYISGMAGLEGVADSVADKNNRMAFCLYPVSMQQLMDTANQHKVLPPKSTWFEPRLLGGLIVQPF